MYIFNFVIPSLQKSLPHPPLYIYIYIYIYQTEKGRKEVRKKKRLKEIFSLCNTTSVLKQTDAQFFTLKIVNPGI